MRFIKFTLIFSLTLASLGMTESVDLIIPEGIHVGNGGDVVACYDGGDIGYIELLDYYEATLLHGRRIDLGASELDIDTKIEIALARMERLDFKRANEYRRLAREFWSEVKFIEGIVLSDIPDSQHIALPASKSCRIEQIAIQRHPTFPEDSRYIISKDLWDVLDNTSKAGLILHEIFLNEAIRDGVKHSLGVRYMNALISDVVATDAMTFQRYTELLQRAEFTKIGIEGLMLKIDPSDPIVFDDLDRLVYGPVVKGSVGETPFGQISLDCNVEKLGGRFTKFHPFSRIEFVQDGMTWSHASPFTQDPDYCRLGANYMRLYDDGTVESANLYPSINLLTPAYDLILQDYSTFWSNGRLRSSRVSTGSTVKGAAGVCVVKGGSSIDFYENGDISTMRLEDLCILRIGNSVLGVEDGMWFHDNGSVSVVSVREGQIDTGANGHITFATEEDNVVSFYPSGVVKNGNLKEARMMNMADGSAQWFPANRRLNFDEVGFVTGFF